jgi:[ribosomal protein S18]-alanine N-acetyltransferase
MSGAAFHVRMAGVGDLAGVVEMERSIAEAPHWGEAEYAAILNEDNGVDVLVRRCLIVAEAEAEGRLLGFAVGKVIGLGPGELESVAVDSAARRNGVGRVLCEAVIDWCRGQGADWMELEVRAGSGGAIGLYGGLGFVVIGRRKGYYRDPVEDALLMKLELAGRVRGE